METPSLSAFGCIFKNEKVIYVGSFCAFLSYISSMEVELCAAMLAMEITTKRNLKRHWIESDSSLVVRTFSSFLDDSFVYFFLNPLISCFFALLGNIMYV